MVRDRLQTGAGPLAVLALFLAAGCGGAPPAGGGVAAGEAAADRDGRGAGPAVANIDRAFDVGGHALHLRCRGRGSPTLILDAGSPDSSASWEPVEARLARMTRTCAYDRAGLGRSEPSPRPRTSGHMVEELRALLAAAGVEPPYVGVGHSFGGLNLRLFARRHPEELLGLVLVDPSHEAFVAGARSLLTREQWDWFQELERQLPERLDWDGTAEELAAAPPLGDMPLLVLVAGRPTTEPPAGFPGRFPGRELAALAARLCAEIASESANGEVITAGESGHYIHEDQPELVLEAVGRVIDACRAAGPGCRAPPAPGRWRRSTEVVCRVHTSQMEQAPEVPVSLEPSPTIEAYKRDVDRTLLRENLRLSPAERVEKMISVLRFVEEVRGAGRGAKRP